MGQLQVQKVNHWHERFADWLIANPQCDVKDAAVVFNCHVGTLYLIKNSDAFKIYFQERSAEVSKLVSDSTVNALTSLPEKVAALADAAIEQLTNRVIEKGRDLPVENLISASDMALRRLGYGAPVAGAQAGQTVVNNFVSVDAEAVRNARARLEGKSIEAKALPAPAVEGASNGGSSND